MRKYQNSIVEELTATCVMTPVAMPAAHSLDLIKKGLLLFKTSLLETCG